MRFIKMLLLGVLLIAIVVVSLANRETVSLSLLPDGVSHIYPFTLEVPIFVVILASVLTGLLIGYILEYLREYKYRRLGSQKSREASKLQQEVKTLKKKHMSEADEVLAILDNTPSNA